MGVLNCNGKNWDWDDENSSYYIGIADENRAFRAGMAESLSPFPLLTRLTSRETPPKICVDTRCNLRHIIVSIFI